jgi:hypothetical protein
MAWYYYSVTMRSGFIFETIDAKMIGSGTNFWIPKPTITYIVPDK